jgi:hypothetical protein
MRPIIEPIGGISTVVIPRPPQEAAPTGPGYLPWAAPWDPKPPVDYGFPAHVYMPAGSGSVSAGIPGRGGHVEFGPGQYGEKITHGELVSVGGSVMDLQSQLAQRELQHEYERLQRDVPMVSIPVGEPASYTAPPSYAPISSSSGAMQLEQVQAPVAAPGVMMMPTEKSKEFPWVWIVGAAIVGLMLAGRKD